MTQAQFYPNIDHPDHVALENLLVNRCKSFNIKCLTVPAYYTLAEKDEYRSLFTHISLYIRSSPDKFVAAKYPFLIDVKSQVRKETGNISVELSAFYFNVERCKAGIPVFYLNFINQEPRVFSPLHVKPHSIFIQPKWDNTDIFNKYAAALRLYFESSLGCRITIHYESTGGSQDPFVLIPIAGLDSYNLDEFIKLREWG